MKFLEHFNFVMNNIYSKPRSFWGIKKISVLYLHSKLPRGNFRTFYHWVFRMFGLQVFCPNFTRTAVCSGYVHRKFNEKSDFFFLYHLYVVLRFWNRAEIFLEPENIGYRGEDGASRKARSEVDKSKQERLPIGWRWLYCPVGQGLDLSPQYLIHPIFNGNRIFLLVKNIAQTFFFLYVGRKKLINDTAIRLF